MLDNSQLVKIESNEGRTVICRVFYKGRDLNQEPQFVGKAERPAKLFSDEPINRRIGYVRWDREAELERQRRAQAMAEAKRFRARQHEDDYEDDE